MQLDLDLICTFMYKIKILLFYKCFICCYKCYKFCNICYRICL